MAIPQLDLPIQLQQKGKKDLSPNVMAELDSAIEKLQHIKGEDEIYAWHHIAKIYAYQNKFDKAIGYFEKVYQKDNSSLNFYNLILSISQSGQYAVAIEKLLPYVQEKRDNELLNKLLNLLLLYPRQDDIKQTQKVLCLFNDNKYQSYNQRFEDILYRVYLLEKIQLSFDDYCLMNDIYNNILDKFYYGHGMVFDCDETIEHDSLFQKIHIFEADAEDILELNRLYEQKIEQMIEQGQLTIEKYIDIISKYNFSFVIHTETHEEWENSRASS